MDRRGLIKRVAGLSAGMAIGGGFPAQLLARAVAGAGSTELLTPDYTARDQEIVDYGFYTLPEAPRILFRGPRFDPRANGQFFTCLGAAQTLGVYVQKPFPTILSEQLGIPVWNAGIGGANPDFLNRHPEIIEIANRGSFVVLQVMSARAESNARFSSTEQIELVKDMRRGDMIRTPVAWDRIMKEDPDSMRRLVSESQRSWVENCKRLLDRITVPVLLFWFSPKDMNLPLDLAKPEGGAGLIDRYPQFVQAPMISDVIPMAQGFVACTSSRNVGHMLLSRFTGQPVVSDYAKLGGRAEPIKETHNTYYPSPEMHEDAAAVLFEQIRGSATFAPLKAAAAATHRPGQENPR